MTLGHRARVAALICLTLAASCGDGEDIAFTPDVELVDTRSLALTGSDVESLNGTYTNCLNRSGTWSLRVAANAVLDHAVLSVIQGDTACTLALTQINTTSDGTLSASAAITLGTGYGTARSFGSPIKYYANAILSSVAYATDFTLTLLFSDDPRVGASNTTASYAGVTATVALMGLTAPNYTLSLSGVAITADFLKIVQTVTGNVSLTAGSSTGDFYVIVNGAVADTYAAINTAYLAGTPVAMATSIAASSFIAPNLDLTGGVIRTLIINKVQNGVRSYQKFAITFNPPS